jgi:hypothetical protein
MEMKEINMFANLQNCLGYLPLSPLITEQRILNKDIQNTMAPWFYGAQKL